MNAFEFCPQPRPYEAGLHWNAVVSRHRIAHTPRAAVQVLAVTGGYAALWVAMAHLDLWTGMLLAVPAGWLLVRVFLILHDCRSGSFFYTRAANRVTGFIAGVMAFTPFTACRWGRRNEGSGRLWAQEVEAWLLNRGVHGRRAGRMAKQATVRWIAAPLFMVAAMQRVAPNSANCRERCAVRLTNAALAAMMAAMIFWLGPQKFFVLQTTVLVVASATGVALYRAQREFEELYWRRERDGEVSAEALGKYAGYRLPRAAQRLLGGVGFHRLHDAGGRVPGYHLRRCHACHPVYRFVRGRSLPASSAAVMRHFAQWLRPEVKAAMATARTASGQVRAVNSAARLAAAHRRAAGLRLAEEHRFATKRRQAAESGTMTAPPRPVTA